MSSGAGRPRSSLCQFYDPNLIRPVRAPCAAIGREAGQCMTSHAPTQPLTNHEPHRSPGAAAAAAARRPRLSESRRPFWKQL